MAMDYVLQTDHLTKVYGNAKVVNGVSMHVQKGDIYGFIGKNGAGKTTFMRMVAGMAQPTAGSIRLFESEALEKQRVKIGSLIEEPGVHAAMTARENLEVVRLAYGLTDKRAVDEALAFVGLHDTPGKKVKDFSMGMKQRLGLALALLRNPDFLILDEPINGLDPAGIKEIREVLLRLNREREITLLVSSHILGELSKIATRYGIIRDGLLIEEFSAGELEEKCRRCHRLTVSNAEKAVYLLEEQLHISTYDVPQTGMLRIFEHPEQTAAINRALMLGGVDVIESYLTGLDLEGYFMERLGGDANV